MKIYHLKTCDTCRKAIKTLQAAGHDLTLVDIRADGISPETLKTIAEAVGWGKLLNARSTTWRGLSEADKTDMDEDKALALMAEHPTLIKRPVIDTGTQITVGWTKEVQERLS